MTYMFICLCDVCMNKVTAKPTVRSEPLCIVNYIQGPGPFYYLFFFLVDFLIEFGGNMEANTFITRFFGYSTPKKAKN